MRLPLNAAVVFRDDGGLYCAAREKFGSWDGALRASRLDPAKVRKKSERGRPTVLEILAFIRRRKREREPVCEAAVPRAFVRAAERRLRGWPAALRAAGIDPDAERRHKRWTPSAVRRQLRAAAQAGDLLDRGRCHSREILLLKKAAVRHFGSFRHAAKIAGVMPEKIGHWDSARVVRELRRLHHTGEPLNSLAARRCHPSLFHAALYHCGSWDGGLRAAGLDPAKIKLKRW